MEIMLLESTLNHYFLLSLGNFPKITRIYFAKLTAFRVSCVLGLYWLKSI